MFECLTGQPPFVSEHIAAVLAKILFEEAPPLSVARPDLPDSVSRLVGRMLAKSPLARISDATALLAEIAAIGEIPDAPPPKSIASMGGQPFVMAGGEQVLVSVVVAQSQDGRRDSLLTLDPVQVEAVMSKSSSLRDLLLQFGVNVEAMVDGSLIATITRQGAATDQAIKAARCALVIKERWPESYVALATGRAVIEGTNLFGEVLGRVGVMIEAARDLPPLPAGAVLLDETTSRLVESHFAVNTLASGQRLLISTNIASDETRLVLGVPTACVGRDRELNLLDATFSGCCDNGTAAVVLVSAGPGIGKSRLRHEFLRRMQAQHPGFEVLTGRGDPMSAGASYGLLSQALRSLFGLVESEDLKLRQDKIRIRVSKSLGPKDVQRVSEFLGEICGTPFSDSVQLRAARQDPRLMGDQIALAFNDFLAAECDQQPVLLLLEDLHWGDALTVKLVDGALRELSDRPFMVLALARPEVEELFPKLWANRARHDIRLGALPKRACQRLLQQVLGNKIAPEVQERLIEQASGNALFLEELMRAVAAGKGDELPETVLAVLYARLMRLPPEARRVLRAASVFGETFWEGGVRKMVGREGTGDQLTAWLQILVESEVIERKRESRFPEESEYVFRHGLMREAAYGMLTDEDRHVGHHLAGCYLEVVGESDPMILAEHFQRGGDLERAIVLYIQAAEHAYESNDLEGALRRAELGLKCGAESQARASLQSIQAYAWFWRNELERALQAGCESLEQLTPGTLRWCKSLSCTTLSAAALGRRDQVSAQALRFGNVAAAPEILGAYVEAASIVSATLGLIGDREMADMFLRHAVDTGKAVSDYDPTVRSWLSYALGRHANALRPEPYSAVMHFRAALDAFSLVGDRRMICVTSGDLGLVLSRMGHGTEAETILRDAITLAVKLDEPITLTWVEMALALLLVERREPAACEEAERLSQQILRSIGESSYYSGFASSVLAAAYSGGRDDQKAEKYGRRAVEILRMTASSAPIGFTALGRALLAAGRASEAVDAALEGVKLVETLGGSGGTELPLRLLLIDSLRAKGDKDQADAAQAEFDRQLALRLENIPTAELKTQFLARLNNPKGPPLF